MFPIVVDFGIARLVQEESDIARITRTGTVCGSPTYMSPEQCTSSKVDHSSDIYSLGVVLYEALTGEVPFLSDELVKVMAMHLSDPPKPLNQVRKICSSQWHSEEVVYKALTKDPDKRYQNMEEFAEALDRVSQGACCTVWCHGTETSGAAGNSSEDDCAWKCAGKDPLNKPPSQSILHLTLLGAAIAGA